MILFTEVKKAIQSYLPLFLNHELTLIFYLGKLSSSSVATPWTDYHQTIILQSKETSEKQSH